MTDFNVTGWRDAWVNPARTGLNTGSSERLVLRNDGRRVFVRPALPNLTGRTVLEATLRAHVRGSWAAQTVVLTRVTRGWAEGRITSASQPTVTTTGQVSVTTGALTDGGVVEWDVTAMVQLFADGTDYYGFRITTDAATQQVLYSSESGEPAWELTITVDDSPDVPSNPRPDGGGAVSSAKTHVGWDFVDLGGESTDQAQSRVEIREGASTADPDLLATKFDSGWVVNADPSYDLATSAYVPGAGPSYFWRVDVQDGDGNASGWSDWAEYTVAAKPALVIDSPTGVFGDPTPQILAHLSSGTVEAWSIVVTGADRADVRAESGRQTGAIDWTVPLKVKGRRVLREGKQHWMRLRVWPTGDWATAIGEQPYVQTWVALSLDNDALLTPVTNLQVTQLGKGDPRHAWSWNRTEAAEAWLLQVDGHTVVRLDADDVTLNAGTYSWTDYGIIPPLRDVTLTVRAVDAGKTSASTTLYHKHTVEGVWLVPHDGSSAVQLAGGDVASWATSDARATYQTVTGGEHDVFYGWRARSGTFEGFVDSRNDVWATVQSLEDYAFDKNAWIQMIWGSKALPVRLRDVDATPSNDIRPNNLEHVVRFGFVERGE